MRHVATNGVEVRGDGVIAFLQRFRHEIKQCGELADLVLRRGTTKVGEVSLSDVPCTGGQIAQRSDDAAGEKVRAENAGGDDAQGEEEKRSQGLCEFPLHRDFG